CRIDAVLRRILRLVADEVVIVERTAILPAGHEAEMLDEIDRLAERLEPVGDQLHLVLFAGMAECVPVRGESGLRFLRVVSELGLLEEPIDGVAAELAAGIVE